MKPTEGKIQELVRASHIIAFEGFYFSEDKVHGEECAMFRTIIHLLSKALETDKMDE